MSIKPPIKCPPDYSILTFRLTECKKAGIVKGIQTLFAMDLQELFVPVSNYEQRMITLRAGETKKIDVSGIGVHWPLNESYEVLFDPDNCIPGTEHSYSLYDESLNLLETISFLVTPQYPTYPLAFNNAVLNSTVIKTKVFFDLTTFNSGRLTVTALTKDTKYRHVFSFDNTGFGGYQPFPYLHPGNLIVPKEKYPRERVKIILVYPDYYKANVLAGCGCIDPSGDMKSNKKYIEYAFDDDVYKINNPNTPIIVTPDFTLPPQLDGFQWQQQSTDHIGYHLKVGDLIATEQDPLLRGFITSINGYDILVDTGIGDGTPLQKAKHVWSPSTVTWRKMGDFYLHTTAQDVTDMDYLYIETLWLRNPHQYDLPIKILLAS